MPGSALLLGGLASMMAAVCTHPLDLIKVRMQTFRSLHGATATSVGPAMTAAISARPPGVLATCLGVVRQEGVAGLYRGLTASLSRQATYSTTRFASYDYFKAQLMARRPNHTLTSLDKIVLAMAAGGIGGLVGSPMDLCNVRMQDDGRLPAEQRRNYRHVGDALTRIVREEGVGRLYAGVRPNVFRAMLMNCGQLAAYDISKQLLLTKTHGLFRDNFATYFISSFIASIAATLMTQPVDVVKTRVMAAKAGQYRGSVHCAVQTVKQEGVTALYKGTVASFTRLGPQTILTFLFLEQLRRLHSKLIDTGVTKAVA